MPQHVSKYTVWKAFLSGVGLTVGVATIVSYYGLLQRGVVKLVATIRGVPWVLPASAINHIEAFEKLRVSLINHIGAFEKLRDPNEIQQLMMLKDDMEEMGYMRYDANRLGDIKSVYMIAIQNRGDMIAGGIVVSIPGAKIVEIIREGREGKEKHVLIDKTLVSCGDLQPAGTLSVTAWTAEQPIKERVERVRIRYDHGLPVRMFVEAPLGAFAHWIDRAIVSVIVASLVGLLVMSLAWLHSKKLADRG